MRQIWLALAVVGCGNSGEPVGMKVQEGRAPVVGRSAKAPSINALEPYERLVRGFEKCALEGNQIVSTCPVRAAFDAEMQGVSEEIRAKVGAKMIDHASPAVRVQAAAMVKLDVLARAASTERDPRVLEAFVRIAGKHGATSPDAAKLLLAAARHADGGVRLDAVDMIAEQRGMPGGAELLVALAETDTDVRVRRAACEAAGRVGGDAVLPLYERTTAQVSDVYASCMEGLAASVTTSEAAYRLFLRRIGEQPRSEQSPPWTVMSIFCDVTQDQRAPWFDAVEVRRALASVVADRAASVQARSAAIESLAGLGATPVELVNLKKQLVAPTDKPLLDKLAAICE